MTTQVRESTKEKPFGFFEYFLSKGFFLKKKNFFKGLEDLDVPITKHSKEEEYYCYLKYDEDGNEKEFKVTFRDQVSTLIGYNFKKSLEIITENIEETYMSQGKVKNYLSLLINDLSHLIDNTKKNQTLVDYQIDMQLYRLLIMIYEKYKLYLNRNEFQPINDAYLYLGKEEEQKEKSEKSKNRAEQNALRSFKWIKHNYLIPVYTLLIEKRIIDVYQNNFNYFLDAFNDTSIIDPPKIIWKLNSKKSDLAPLVRFLKLLMEKGYIETVDDNAKFAHMIEGLFLNYEGQLFKNTINKTSSIKMRKELSESHLYQELEALQTDTTG